MGIWSGYLRFSKENMPEVSNLRFPKTRDLEDRFTSGFSPTLSTIYYFITPLWLFYSPMAKIKKVFCLKKALSQYMLFFSFVMSDIKL